MAGINQKSRAKFTAWAFLSSMLILLSACSPAQPTPDLTATAVFQQALIAATQAVPTSTQTPSPTPTPTPSPTRTSTSTPVRTPPVLPGTFQTSLLKEADAPHTYIQNVCVYLKDRLNPNKAAPGTVVMPIMFHSITDGEINHPYQVTDEQVQKLLDDLKEQGFESITMQQLAGFLQHNEKIPPRSVILIVDDLHTEEYYREHFIPFLKEYNWTVTNAWISEPEASKRVKDGNIRLQEEGWVDHQAHGVVHNVNITEFKPGTVISTELYGSLTGEEFTRAELAGSMKAITETFGKAPIAYIWPGGNFSQLGVQVAREVGYRLGFTVNPRGPLMFNWIPLADEKDPSRPSYLPEGYVDDPLMVLPRYWDADAALHIDAVRQIGKQAADAAQANRPVELAYYDIVCKPKLGEIPTPAP